MAGKFLRFFSPFVRVMPELKQPQREVSFKEKLMWTGLALIIYLIMSNIPLYGVDAQATTDYYYWLRVIAAVDQIDDKLRYLITSDLMPHWVI